MKAKTGMKIIDFKFIDEKKLKVFIRHNETNSTFDLHYAGEAKCLFSDDAIHILIDDDSLNLNYKANNLML